MEAVEKTPRRYIVVDVFREDDDDRDTWGTVRPAVTQAYKVCGRVLPKPNLDQYEGSERMDL